MKHRLVGEIVKPDIRIRRPLYVVDAWQYLNEVAFGGELTPPIIRVVKNFGIYRNGKTVLCDGAYIWDKKEKRSRIWLEYTASDPLGSLFHEMVHQFVQEVIGDSHPLHEHGLDFCESFIEAFMRLEDHVRRLQKFIH